MQKKCWMFYNWTGNPTFRYNPCPSTPARKGGPGHDETKDSAAEPRRPGAPAAQAQGDTVRKGLPPQAKT